MQVIQASVSTLLQWVGLTLGSRGPADEAQRRFVSVARGASSALVARGLAALTGLLIVPLAVGYLGAERYGAWVTISSTLGWLYLADAGLGNGLTTLFTDAWSRRRPELARQHLATAIWLLACMAAVVAVLFILIWPKIDWSVVLGVQSALARSEVPAAVAFAVAAFLAGFPLSVLDRVYAACQDGAIGNFWSGAGAIASLAMAALAIQTRGGMVGLVVALAGAPLVMKLASAAWLFGRHHPELRPSPSAVRRDSLHRLSHTGSVFFLIQIAALILFNTDNVIIARILGAEQVTPYSVAWTLFTVPSMAIALAFPYLWPAYAEAFARGDSTWIRRTFRISLLASFGMAVLVAIPLIAFGRPLIGVWAGKTAVPPFSVLVWMGIWSLTYASMNPIACVLNAAGRLKGQAIFASLSAVVNVGLSIRWAHRYGISGVIAATVVSYLVFAALPICLEARRVLARLESPSFESV